MLSATIPTRPPVRLRQLQVALLVVTLLTAMDQTIVATALPAVIGDIGGRAAMGWVFAGYTLAMTIGMPVYGRLGDLFGRRTLFLGVLVAFVIASAACGLASSMAQLVCLRALQGLAGGGVLVLSQAVVADAVPARERGRFMAPVGLVFATATVVGPLIGGTLTDTVGWRWIFWVNLPIGAIAILLATRSIPHRTLEAAQGRLDILGSVIYGLAVAGLVVLTGLVALGRSWTSPLNLVLIVVTLLSATIFVHRMLRHADPLIPIGVLRNRTVTIASCLGFVNGASVFALVGFIPTLVQELFGIPATASGALLLALVLGMMVSVTSTAWWTAQTGRYRRFPVVGCALAAVAMLALSGLNEDFGVVRAGVCVALLGVGVGFFLQLATTMAQDAVPSELIGSATSTVSLVRELGVTLGSAAVGSALAASVSLAVLFTILAALLAAGGAVSLLLPNRKLTAKTPPS